MGNRFLQIAVTLALQGGILFLSAGKISWLWAWVFLGLYLVGIAANAFFMLRANREAIARRAESSGAKGWDRIVGGLWSLAYFLLIPLTAGLDERFSWTGGISLAVHLLGVLLFLLGLALFGWAMVSNAYFSTVVRIQQDRGHTVCTAGPYRLVRHPGYVGAILQCLGLPLLLGSTWALIPGGLAALLLIVRTGLEDQTLQAELDGYAAYTGQVRFRLVPGIW